MLILDSKDYQGVAHRLTRHAVRAIIWVGEKLALIESDKYHDVKFPGGGINENEDAISALLREVEEETGLLVRKETIQEYKVIREIRKSIFDENTIFDMTSIYYTCEVKEEKGELHLDPYEVEYGYHLVFMTPEEAIEKNKKLDLTWAMREVIVLEELRKGANS